MNKSRDHEARRAGDAVYWVGLDVAKKTFDAAVVGPGVHFPETPMRAVPAQTFARDEAGVAQCLAWVGTRVPEGAALRVVMEATGVYSIELSAWVCRQAPGCAPAIVNPEHTAAYAKSLGLRNKTDRLDARALAFFGAERRPAPYEPLTAAHRLLRELSRYRDALVAEQVAESNRAEQHPQAKFVRTLQARRERQRRKDLARVEAEMKRAIHADPALRHDYERLVTIPGVGFVTAAVVLAELGDLRRFARARQAAAFAGLTPRETASGTSVHGRTRLCKKGNARVRQALYLAAMACVRTDSFLSEAYRHLRERGKTPMAALGAVMRKLVTVMRAVLLSDTPFSAGGKPKKKQPA